MGLVFLPSSAWLGTDLLQLRSDVMTVDDPYGEAQRVAFPTISVDLAVIHALEVDKQGNVAINNNLAIDQLLVYAADTVIVTAERLVERIEPEPYKTIIPAPGIDRMYLAVGGALPTSCYPLYPMRGRDFAHYVDQCAAGQFDVYIERFMDDV